MATGTGPTVGDWVEDSIQAAPPVAAPQTATPQVNDWVEDTPARAPVKPGFGQQFIGRIKENAGALYQAASHPLDTAASMADSIVNPKFDPEVVKEGADAWKQGRYGRAIASGVESLPIIGPTIRRSEKDIEKGDYGAVAADVATAAVPFIPKGVRGIARGASAVKNAVTAPGGMAMAEAALIDAPAAIGATMKGRPDIGLLAAMRAGSRWTEGRAKRQAAKDAAVAQAEKDAAAAAKANKPVPDPKPDLKGAQARESMRRVISKQEGPTLEQAGKDPMAGTSTVPHDPPYVPPTESASTNVGSPREQMIARQVLRKQEAPALERVGKRDPGTGGYMGETPPEALNPPPPPVEPPVMPPGKGTGTPYGGPYKPEGQIGRNVPRGNWEAPVEAVVEESAQASTPFKPNPRIARLVRSGGSDATRSIPGRPSRRGNLPGEGYTLDTYEKPGAEVPKANPVVTTVEDAAEEAVKAAEQAAPRARPVVKKGPQKSAAVRKAEEELAAGVAPKGVKRKKGDPVVLGDDTATSEFKAKEAKSIKILTNITARLKKDGITPDNVARARASVKARGINVDLFEDFLTDIKKGGAKFALGGVVDAAPAQKSRVRHSKRGIPYGPPQELRKLRKGKQL